MKIEYPTIKFAEYLVTIDSSYRPLPEELAKLRGAIVNVDNSEGNDQQCFEWAVTRAMFPVTRRGNVLTVALRKQVENFNWDRINFPTSLLENLIKISVMVLSWNEKERRTEYLRLPRIKHGKAIRLFLYEDHYSTIKSMSTLVRRDFGDNANHFCNFSSFRHRSEERVKDHMKDCIAEELKEVVMPKERGCVEFKNWEYTLRKPHVIYADFESCLVKEDVVKGKNTTQTQIHTPAAYCYHLVSDIDPTDNITVQYTANTDDESVPLHFIKSLSELVSRLGEKYAEPKPMIITEEEQTQFDVATTCWVCEVETFNGDEKLRKVRVHCHFTGKYRGVAHNKCNLKLRRDKSIPVLFHNGKGYDFQLFMRDLGGIPGKISVIAKNEEQYISITKISLLVTKISGD